MSFLSFLCFGPRSSHPSATRTSPEETDKTQRTALPKTKGRADLGKTGRQGDTVELSQSSTDPPVYSVHNELKIAAQANSDLAQHLRASVKAATDWD